MKAHDQLRRACRKLADQVGTPGFEPALAAFWAALATARKTERRHD